VLRITPPGFGSFWEYITQHFNFIATPAPEKFEVFPIPADESNFSSRDNRIGIIKDCEPSKVQDK
jgi:hypothetical protein